MKKKSKTILSVFLIVLAMLLCACTKGEAPEQTVEGTVVQYSDSQLSVESGSGTYVFSLEQVSPDVLPSLIVAGSRVLVTYKGTPGDDACEILQITLVQTEPDAGPMSDSSDAASSAPESTSAPVPDNSVEGVITDAAMHSVTIQTDDGQTYTFDMAMNGEQLYLDVPSNLAIGSRVLVGYSGTLGELDCEPVSIQETATPDGTPVGSLHSVSGTVSAVSDTSVTIESGDGSLTFAIGSGTEMHIPGGVTDGMQIRVEYRGEYADDMTAQAVYAA